MRKQEKTVSAFLMSLQLWLFLTWLKVLPFLPKFYCVHRLQLQKSDCGNFSNNNVHAWQQPKNEAIEVAREARRPRGHVNFTYSRAPFLIVSLNVVLRWSTCNANLQWYDVARKIVLVKHPVADDCLRFLQCCNTLQGFQSDSKTCSKCNMSANSCEKHTLRIGVANWPA